MSSRLVCVLAVGAALGAQALKLHEASEEPTNTTKTDLIVRFALLSPSGSGRWLNTIGVPDMQSALCTFEKFFAPKWQQRFGTRPTYMVYTDDHSHKLVSDVIANLPYPTEAFLLRNLDEEQSKIPAKLYGKFNLNVLADVDRASIRRQFADSGLPANVARLLVGPDVMILGEPWELFDKIEANPNMSYYLADRRSFGELYTVAGLDSSKQCPGLIGDFIYLPPTADVTGANLMDKLDKYMSQPVSERRLSVPCEACVSKSGGFHASDEIAWSLAIPEAVPCEALSWKYAHMPPQKKSAHQVIHGRHGVPPQYGC